MSGLEILLVYLSGFISGIIAIILWSLFYAKKKLTERKTKIEEAYKKFGEELNKFSDGLTEKTISLEKRLNRIRDITTEQLDLQSQAEGPQKNSMDGKYKNTLVNAIKKLDEEKQDLLSSILADGFDPELSVMAPDGSVEHMKLSEYMARSNFDIPTKPSEEPKTVKSGKFLVYKGGKDDNEGGGSTTH